MKPVVVALDDCNEILDIYQYVLENACKAVVYRTTDADEALSFVEKYSPDLFITDLVHCGLDGAAITKQLRSNSKTELIPI
jgi:CheY-like chemotaxis protein